MMAGYLFDTHIHTAESSPCSDLTAEETVQAYHAAGFSGFCVTDHYNERCFAQWGFSTWTETVDALLSGYRRAAECGAALGMDILLGTEIYLAGLRNEFLLFGLTEAFFYEYPNLHTYAAADFRRLMDEHGFLVFKAHPYRGKSSPADSWFLDGAEVLNWSQTKDPHNDMAAAYARAHNLYVSAGSDCHAPEDVGRHGICTDERIQTMAQLVAALQSPETKLYTKMEA